jgi:hypothetical protein
MKEDDEMSKRLKSGVFEALVLFIVGLFMATGIVSTIRIVEEFIS